MNRILVEAVHGELRPVASSFGHLQHPPPIPSFQKLSPSTDKERFRFIKLFRAAQKAQETGTDTGYEFHTKPRYVLAVDSVVPLTLGVRDSQPLEARSINSTICAGWRFLDRSNKVVESRICDGVGKLIPVKNWSCYTRNTPKTQQGKIKHLLGCLRDTHTVNCLSGDVPIISSNGLVPISSLRIGDMVLSHDGAFHRISKIFRRYYHGPIIRMVIYGSPYPISVTPEHPVFSASFDGGDTVGSGWFDGKWRTRYQQLALHDLTWQLAKSITMKSIFAFPTISTSNDRTLMSVPLAPRMGRPRRLCDTALPINEPLLRLIGYYLAEGYATIRRHQGKHGKTLAGACVELTFGKNLKEYLLAFEAKTCAEALGFTATITVSQYGCRVHITSVPFTYFMLRNFGTGSDSKKIPRWMLELPKEKILWVLQSYLDGDGHAESRKRGYWTAATVSPQLALGLKLLGEKVGWSTHLSVHITKPIIQGRHVHVVPASHIRFILERQYVGTRAWRDSSTIYSRPREISIPDFDGFVYNLEVEGTHSYCTPNMAFHNCLNQKEVKALIPEVKDSRGQLEVLWKRGEVQTDTIDRQVITVDGKRLSAEQLAKTPPALWNIELRKRKVSPAALRRRRTLHKQPLSKSTLTCFRAPRR